MIKTESYVQEAAGGMVYRLIPVTDECKNKKGSGFFKSV